MSIYLLKKQLILVLLVAAPGGDICAKSFWKKSGEFFKNHCGKLAICSLFGLACWLKPEAVEAVGQKVGQTIEKHPKVVCSGLGIGAYLVKYMFDTAKEENKVLKELVALRYRFETLEKEKRMKQDYRPTYQEIQNQVNFSIQHCSLD